MTGSDEPGRPALIAAWVAVAVVPAVVLLSLIVGYVLAGLVGAEGDPGKRSLVADLLGLVVTLGLVALPVLTARRLGARAVSTGDHRGTWPRLAAVGLFAVIAAMLVVQLATNAGQGLY